MLERVAAAGGTVAILWHNDRFAGPYARGWDRCYERLLDWVVRAAGGWRRARTCSKQATPLR